MENVMSLKKIRNRPRIVSKKFITIKVEDGIEQNKKNNEQFSLREELFSRLRTFPIRVSYNYFGGHVIKSIEQQDLEDTYFSYEYIRIIQTYGDENGGR